VQEPAQPLARSIERRRFWTEPAAWCGKKGQNNGAAGVASISQFLSAEASSHSLRLVVFSVSPCRDLLRKRPMLRTAAPQGPLDRSIPRPKECSTQSEARKASAGWSSAI
jgi:hypothetical protein